MSYPLRFLASAGIVALLTLFIAVGGGCFGGPRVEPAEDDGATAANPGQATPAKESPYVVEDPEGRWSLRLPPGYHTGSSAPRIEDLPRLSVPDAKGVTFSLATDDHLPISSNRTSAEPLVIVYATPTMGSFHDWHADTLSRLGESAAFDHRTVDRHTVWRITDIFGLAPEHRYMVSHHEGYTIEYISSEDWNRALSTAVFLVEHLDTN